MDGSKQNTDIAETLRKARYNSVRTKLQKLLVDRRTPFLSSKNDMEIIKILGYGVFGIVELVRHEKVLYAHKRPQADTPTQRNGILEEALKLTDINEYHPNIQRLYFINLKSSGFLMDYCCYGSLDKVVTDPNFNYTLYDAINWSYQLADALSFLHSKRIMHRDVKLQNILLKDNYQTLVLTDYGTATQCGRSLLTNQAGTPITMAPEVYNTTKYDEQCDIYSWSIVFWQLLSKQILPYGNQNMSFIMKVTTEKLRPYQLNNCPELLIALMYRSWHSDPRERPTLSFIKKILRLILNVLPTNREDYSEDVIHEVKKQWLNDSDLSEKYLPHEPHSDNEKSKNIYQDHLRKMKHILDIKQNITDVEQKISIQSKQNLANRDVYDKILTENEQLQQQIRALREMTLLNTKT